MSLDVKKLGGVRMALLKQVILAHEASRRVGCASTKTRAQVRGGGRKPWRQKGTGRARAGSRRSPLWRGGGIAFGPHPRDYETQISESMRRAALGSAIVGKAMDGTMAGVEGVDLTSGKTRDVAALLKILQVDGSCLLGLKTIDDKTRRACRNVAHLNLRAANNICAYDIAAAGRVLIGADCLDDLVARASARGRGGQAS